MLLSYIYIYLEIPNEANCVKMSSTKLKTLHEESKLAQDSQI
jgi:hypothetical protein